jgi:hypothetical protein
VQVLQKTGTELYSAIAVDGGILCVQRRVRDAGLGLDGRASVSAHDCIRLGASTIADAEDLVDLKIREKKKFSRGAKLTRNKGRGHTCTVTVDSRIQLVQRSVRDASI